METMPKILESNQIYKKASLADRIKEAGSYASFVEKVRARAAHAYFFWTEDEIANLKKLHNEGIKVVHMATILQRTRGAVTRKLEALGLKFRRRRKI